MKTKLSLSIVTLAASTLLAIDLQAGQAPQPGICNRACWGARNGTCTTTMTGLTRAIIHHTANTGDFTTDYESAKAKMRSTQGYHMDTKGWCDIGYHFLTSAGGHIFEGRKGAMTSLIKGNHAGCGNVNSFGFTFLGYFHPPYNQNPPVAMRNAMYDVIAWRMPSTWSPYGGRTAYSGSLNGTGAPLDTHQWVGASTGSGCSSTACPGDVIINNYITGNFFGGEMRNGINARKSSVGATSAPDLAAWGGGRLDLVVRGGDNAIWHKYYDNGAWSGWSSLGGGATSDPSCASWGPNRLDVVIRGQDNAIWHKYWNGTSWSGWMTLGGAATSGPSITAAGPGRLEVVIRGGDNGMWRKSWDGVSWSVDWQSWD